MRVLAVALCLAGAAAAQTLPLNPGAGFTWEHVGDRPNSAYDDLFFDAGGTLWDSFMIRWLDPATLIWVQSSTRDGRAILALGPHPAGGPARADTVLYTTGATRRSVDGGVTWEEFQPVGNYALIEIPAGYPYAGRLLVGNERGYSDDRGATWTPAVDLTEDARISARALLPLPPADRLPGAATGVPTGASPDWPAGRIVAPGYGGVNLSDDGGETYRRSTWGGLGLHGQRITVVRRPDGHPLGAGPRLIMAAAVSGNNAVSAWTSDDAGETWQRRADLYEPFTSAGYGKTRGLFALPDESGSDPGVSGAAIAVIGLGHIYQTTDAGETWAVVGRAPEMSIPAEPGEPPVTSVFAGAAEMGPDGRLYIAATASGPAEAWVWRTTEAFAVAETGGDVLERAAVGLRVSPNPSSGGAVRVEVSVETPVEVRAYVVDALGRRVADVLAGAVAGTRVADVSTAGWSAGVYALVVEAGAERNVEAFTVVR